MNRIPVEPLPTFPERESPLLRYGARLMQAARAKDTSPERDDWEERTGARFLAPLNPGSMW